MGLAKQYVRQMTLNVDAEVAKLVAEIKRLHASAAAGLPTKHDQKVTHTQLSSLNRLRTASLSLVLCTN